MICRLCLKTLQQDEAIFIFREDETKWAKMITKYFHLELTEDDNISTMICSDCCEHLEEFHKFWIYVDQKQSTLRNEFFEIKCDVQLQYNEEHMPDEQELLESNTVMLEMKDALIESNWKTEISSNDEMDNVNDITEENVETNVKAAVQYSDADSTDDDTPLLMLKSKCQQQYRKIAKVKRKKKSQAKLKEKPLNVNKKSIKFEKSQSNEEMITNFMPLICGLCQQSSESYGELRIHFNTIHNCRAYLKCCNKTFYRPSKLVEHITWHRNPEVFKCEICNKQLRSKAYLEVHKLRVHEEKEVKLNTCQICKKVFRNSKCFEKHLEWHESEKSYNCDICGKSFATPQRVRCHIASIHENIHSHVCDFCGKKFKFKPSFERHIQLHQGFVEEPAQCEQCGLWMKSKERLRIHRYKHDQVNVKCEICQRICPSRAALIGHMKYMHKMQSNLQCTFCDKKFKVTKNLQEHIATHTGVQLFSCPHCAKECRSKANMYVHIKRYHVEEWTKAQIARSNDPSLKANIE